MTDAQKLEAVRTYLNWDIKSESNAIEILENIWSVVIEGKLKNGNNSTRL